ncbi:MAG: ribonuclease E/G, partial [Actinomycetes bacterium]
AEGATEEQIRRDVQRLTEQWKRLSEKAGKVKAPELLHGETDLATRVVRDIFNEDFSSLIVSGDGAIDTIEDYIASVAPDLADRVHRWTKNEDVFAAHRIDEQLTKALDRKVWLPSGGSLVIDHTEAMTVVDVNTGRFTGQGGNLEETVTRNNLEAAEEVVRQLRLRDTGGIIVIDFIDMVLETNRDLVLRRLLECLSRDRTKHQVAEVTSLGLVQMTRKRIGQGLLETFSTVCECCNGRGVKVQMDPVDRGSGVDGTPVVARRRGRPAGPIPGAPIPPKAAEQMSEAPADDEQVTPSPGEEGEAVILDALTAEAEAEDALFDLAEAEAQAAEGELEEPVDDH